MENQWADDKDLKHIGSSKHLEKLKCPIKKDKFIQDFFN